MFQLGEIWKYLSIIFKLATLCKICRIVHEHGSEITNNLGNLPLCLKCTYTFFIILEYLAQLMQQMTQNKTL